MIQEAAAVKEQVVIKVKVVIHPQEEEPQDLLVQEEGHPLHQGGQQGGSTPPQQTGGAGFPGGTPQSPPGISQPNRHPDPWAPLDRSRKSPPKLMLPANYRSCSILDMRQLLESWYDKSTFAIATWRGDAQRYWLTQVLDCARNRHDQWLQSTPSQRASLEPAYILGDRKQIPEAQNAVESVLRTESKIGSGHLPRTRSRSKNRFGTPRLPFTGPGNPPPRDRENPEKQWKITNSMPDMTGRPGCRTMEMFGGRAASYLARTPRIPFLVFSSTGLERKNVLDYQGRAGSTSIAQWTFRPVIFGVEKFPPLLGVRARKITEKFYQFFRIFPVGGLPGPVKGRRSRSK